MYSKSAKKVTKKSSNKIPANHKKIFDKLKCSNNGICYYDEKKNKKKSGGGYVKSYDCNTDDTANILSDVCNEIEDYKNNISKIEGNYSNTYFSNFSQKMNDYNNNFDNYFIHRHIILTPDKDTSEIMHENLKNTLLINSKYTTNKKTLYCNKHGIYKIEDLENTKRIFDNEPLELDFSYHKYNKDIVTAYQHDFIENFDNLDDFIKMQHEFINRLPLSEKIIINDYTKKSAFNFYRTAYGEAITFKNKPDESYATVIDGSPVYDLYINSSDTEIKKFRFGDSYYKQIFDVIGATLFTHHILKSRVEFKDAFEEYKQNAKFENKHTFNDIDDYWNFIKVSGNEREDPDSLNIFTNNITLFEWQCVLILFAKDINNILLKSPRFDRKIYCYRGTKMDYAILEPNDRNEIKVSDIEMKLKFEEGTFTSIRPGSFSFNFNKAKQYSYDNTSKTYKYIYKIIIEENAPVLYLPSLSYASDEFEILHGGFGKFSYRSNKEKTYNNINNKYGILSNENDAFDSIDLIFSGYNIGTELKNDNTTFIVKNMISRTDETVIEAIKKAKDRQLGDLVKFAGIPDNRVRGGGNKKKVFKKEKK